MFEVENSEDEWEEGVLAVETGISGLGESRDIISKYRPKTWRGRKFEGKDIRSGDFLILSQTQYTNHKNFRREKKEIDGRYTIPKSTND